MGNTWHTVLLDINMVQSLFWWGRCLAVGRQPEGGHSELCPASQLFFTPTFYHFLLLTFPHVNVSQLLKCPSALICKSESPFSLGPGPRVLKLTISILYVNDLLVVAATNRHNSQIRAIRENWIASTWWKFGYILFHKSWPEVTGQTISLSESWWRPRLRGPHTLGKVNTGGENCTMFCCFTYNILFFLMPWAGDGAILTTIIIQLSSPILFPSQILQAAVCSITFGRSYDEIMEIQNSGLGFQSQFCLFPGFSYLKPPHL